MMETKAGGKAMVSWNPSQQETAGSSSTPHAAHCALHTPAAEAGCGGAHHQLGPGMPCQDSLPQAILHEAGTQLSMSLALFVPLHSISP